MEVESAHSDLGLAGGNDNASHHDDQVVNCFEFSGLDLLRRGDDDHASDDSSYSSYCNDSLQLSRVPKKTIEQLPQRRSSMDGATDKQSNFLNSSTRSASVKEMLRWLHASDEEYEDDLNAESSMPLERTTVTLSKHHDAIERLSRSFSSDILASQSVAGGAGRAA